MSALPDNPRKLLLSLLSIFIAAVFVISGLVRISENPSLFQTQILASLEIYWLEFLFFTFISSSLFSYQPIQTLLKPIFSSKNSIIFALILVGFTYFVFFVMKSQHLIFYDEDLYLQIADHIARLHKTGLPNDVRFLHGQYLPSQIGFNKEPNGWPFFLSRLIGIYQSPETVGFLANKVLFLLTALLAYLITALLLHPIAGLTAATLWLSIPQNLVWANTVSAETSSAFFSGLAILGSLIVFKSEKKPKNSLLLAALTSGAIATSFRPESILILLPCAGLLLLTYFRFKIFKTHFAWTLSSLLLLITPEIWHLYSVRHENWGSQTSKFSLSHIFPNLSANLPYYFQLDKDFGIPLLVTLFFLFSCVWIIKNLKRSPELFLILIWFLLFFGIFIPFYAGSYHYGVDVRFSVLSHLPFVILSGIGLSVALQLVSQKKETAVGITFALTLVFFSPSWRSTIKPTTKAWACTHDHEFIREISKTLPPFSYVFSHTPSVFSLQPISSGGIGLLDALGKGNLKNLFQNFTGGVYVYYGFWCQTDSLKERATCEYFKEKYKGSEVIQKTYQNKTYSLYRLSPEEID